MRKVVLSIVGALLVGLMAVASAAAAGPPAGSGGASQAGTGQGTVLPPILGLTQAQVQDLRQDGLSLAQIAERQKVDPKKLVDALAARYAERIDARVANGGLTAAQATELKSQVELRAKDMVYKTTAGGMGGAAVGAGAGRGGAAGAGAGNGTGTCDGSGPHGAGRP